MRDSLYAPSAQPDVNGHSQPRPGLACHLLVSYYWSHSFHAFFSHTALFAVPCQPSSDPAPSPSHFSIGGRHRRWVWPSALALALALALAAQADNGGRHYDARSRAPYRRIPSPGFEAQREDEEARTLAPAPAGRKVRPTRGHFPPLLAVLGAFLGTRSRGEMRALRGFCECE